MNPTAATVILLVVIFLPVLAHAAALAWADRPSRASGGRDKLNRRDQRRRSRYLELDAAVDPRSASSFAGYMERAEQVKLWQELRIRHSRKVALARAGISAADARAPQVRRLTRADLDVMAALRDTRS